MSFLTLYSALQEPYAKYGLEHFLKKYGFEVTAPQQKADVHIGYSPSEDSNSRVQIVLIPDAQDKTCYINIIGETISIFKKPVQTSGEHVLGTVKCENEEYSCLSVSNNIITIGFNIFEEIGRILAGYYDSFFVAKDELGKALRVVPVVDVLEDALFSAISQVLPNASSCHRFKWPDDHKFALVLTHDVDRIYKTYQYLPSLINSIKKLNVADLGYHLKNLLFRHGKSNPYWTFEIICKIESDLGVKSTYYFLNEKGKHNPFSPQSWILYRGVYNIENQQVREAIIKLAKAGFEIGVHGSYNSYSNLELLQSEKRILESIINSEITGIRQHYLNYDNNLTPELQNKAGFRYDSSIGFKPDVGVGFRRGTCFPFQVLMPDLSISPVLEIPLLIMDGAMDAGATSEDCFKLMDQVEKYGGVLTILWHTQRFNPREYPGMVDLYRNIVKEAKARGAWIARADEVYQWMTKSNENATVRAECAR